MSTEAPLRLKISRRSLISGAVAATILSACGSRQESSPTNTLPPTTPPEASPISIPTATELSSPTVLKVTETTTSIPATSTLIPTETPTQTKTHTKIPSQTPVPPTETPKPTDTAVPTEVDTPTLTPSGPDFVKVDGTQLSYKGSPFFFLGVNRYDIDSSPQARCGGLFSDEDLENLYIELNSIGVNAMRHWLFQGFTENGFDRFNQILSLSEKYNIKTLPTLDNHWGDCTPGQKTLEWYKEGYKSVADGERLSYKDHVIEVVSTYKDDPRILMWQLMNEAECTEAQVLADFAADMAATIRNIDPNHIISLGTIGTGQPGTDNENYKLIHENIDICDIHDYDPSAPIPGDQWNGLPIRIRQSEQMAKPIFVGEVGMKAGTGEDLTLEQRATIMEEKFNAYFESGVSGILIWSARGANNERDVYGFNLEDPLANVVKNASGLYLAGNK